MAFFDLIRDYSHRRQAKKLNKRASTVQLVSECVETLPDNFIFPGPDHFADITVDGQRVGYVHYGLNPLLDRLYITMLDIEPKHRRQGNGLSALWQLRLTYQVPIVPLHQYASSGAFWELARARFAAAGAVIEEELHVNELTAAKQRWQHLLLPEPEHERQIRELQDSPEWLRIKAQIDAEKDL